MKNDTLNALLDYIQEVDRAIRNVANFGPGADLSLLGKATDDLRDALNHEPITE